MFIYRRGPPRITNTLPGRCPFCDNLLRHEVEVDVESTQLAGGRGIGVYIECPVCLHVTPMVIISITIRG